MNLIQSLPTELRERVVAEAARRGQEPDTLMLGFVREGLDGQAEPERPGSDPGQVQAADEKAERFRRWADSQPRRGVPVIPLEALDREHIYGNHA